MNIEKMNSWMTLVANIGVVAGIVFLAFEIRQNNELLTAQARSVAEGNRMRDEMLILNNPELREVLVKKNLGMDGTPAEELLYRVFQSTVLNGWQATWLEYQAGLVDIGAYSGRWRDLFWNMEYEERWEDTKHRYVAEFVAWVESNIVSQPPSD